MVVARAIRSVLLCCLFLSLLAGCASGDVADPAPTTLPAGAGATTLVLWHGWSGVPYQALTRLIDRYNQAHPEGRIFAQSMPLASLGGDVRAAAAAGTGPHIVLVPSGWLGSLAADNVILPLDTLLSPAEQRPLLPVTVGAAQATGQDGKPHLYGQPLCFDTLALFYNKDNVLAAPSSTADLFDLARGLSDPDATPPRWGLALNLSVETTIGYLYAFDGRMFDDQGELVLGGTGRAGAERWLEWLASLNADQRLLARPYSSVEVDRELKNSQALMTFAWAHQLAEYRQLWGDKLGIAPLPKLSETNRAPQPYVQSDVLAINARASTAEQRAAADFLRFMASDEAQSQLLAAGLQPASQQLKLDGDEPLQVAARTFREQAASAQPLPNSPERALLREEIWQMQRVVLEGRTQPADAVTEADNRLRQALQR